MPRPPATALALLTLAACGPGGARQVEMGRLHTPTVLGLADPTVRPARLLPSVVDESASFGTESGGGTRIVTAGLRVVSTPKGGLLAANDRFPQAPQSTLALPERLGGGFLFVLGSAVWRADRWLGPARPIFTSYQAVQSLTAGLDRVYVRTQNATLAVDGRSGAVLDLGPWPASPLVASYAAADGWRAAAVTDLRGAIATFDAGASWRALDLPIDPKVSLVTQDSLAIGGFDSGHAETWFELRSDGSLARMSAPPREAKGKLAVARVAPRGPAKTTTTTPAEPARPPESVAADFVAKTFGARPLAAAIEDGWPLGDGSAVVARDGALAKVSLGDGALTELVHDAFPLKQAQCHPVSLARRTAPGAFAFVCGEPRGATVLYRYDAGQGRLVEMKRFTKPRVVTSSGSGALAVRGACAEDAEPTPLPRPALTKLKDDEKEGEPPAPPAPLPPPENVLHPYCVLGHDDAWREIHVHGDVGAPRVVALADGRIVVVSPPQTVGGPARLTLLDARAKGRPTTVAVTFPPVSADVARVLRLGLWLDGFEERRPGVLGGWIEAAGAVLGVEIALDGKATPGQFVREAGLPFVSGRYGLGWTSTRRGYETTDGGMTWASIDVPDALVPTARIDRRACGPIGCLANGWLRVGWGEAKREPASPPPAPWRPASTFPVPQVALTCEPLAPMPPASPAAHVHAATLPTVPVVRPRLPGMAGSSSVLGTVQGSTELPAFFHASAPTFRDPDRGIYADVRELAERYPSVGSLARIYGWGPKTGEWETQGHWQVKWLSPFAGWPDLRASLPSLPPAAVVDLTRSGYYGSSAGYASSYGNAWQLSPGDDAAHALLLGRKTTRAEAVFELEADRAPVELKRADGEPFGEIEGSVRAAGRWYIATGTTTANAGQATIVWQVEGGLARELVRVPRIAMDGGSASKGKLARRSDGRSIALVVDGQPGPERAANLRWALPIDLETGALAEPEPLGYADLAGRTFEACADDGLGWTFDTTLPSTTARVRLPHGGGTVSGLHARLRLSRTRACVERLAGNYDGQSTERAAELSRSGPAARGPVRASDVLVTAMSAQTRFPLRCAFAK